MHRGCRKKKVSQCSVGWLMNSGERREMVSVVLSDEMSRLTWTSPAAFCGWTSQDLKGLRADSHMLPSLLSFLQGGRRFEFSGEVSCGDRVVQYYFGFFEIVQELHRATCSKLDCAPPPKKRVLGGCFCVLCNSIFFF